MLEWISANSATLSVLISLATLAVWAIYLQLLLIAFRRQRKPKILINRGGGTNMSAHCLISNMSAEPIYVESIIVKLEMGSEEHSLPVTDIRQHQEEGREAAMLSERTRQGPLERGKFMSIGTFGSLIDRAVRQSGLSPEEYESLTEMFDSFELTVIAAYGADDLAIAAARRFNVRGSGEDRDLIPYTTDTHQIYQRRERRRIQRLLQEHL